MIDPAITEYLNQRKELWLKGKIKTNTSLEDEQALQEDAEEKFSFGAWVADASKRAKQLSLLSHPSKFSHPSAKTTNLIAGSEARPDGLLRTGNVTTDLDVLGNAAALDVHKFLSLTLADGKTILEHLEDGTDSIKEQFAVAKVPYTDIEQGLLAIKRSDEKGQKTSDKVKQVYFPINTNREYHLLSILTPSAMMFELKNRIRTMHFSDSTKEARASRRANVNHPEGYSEIFGLSVIGFGGTKPQNISVLNSQHGGVAYLLPSTPPNLAERKIFPPRADFFTDSLRSKWFSQDFQLFHKVVAGAPNNMHVRGKRDRIMKSIIYQVIDRLWVIRSLNSGWSDSDNYKNLPRYQKIWLDQKYRDARQTDTPWFDSVKTGIARWFIKTYADVLGNKTIPLGDDLISHTENLINDCEGGLL